MRSFIVLTWLLFVLLLSCTALPVGQPLISRVLGCDDPEVEQAAMVALNDINKKSNGYKFALNQIEKVKVLPRRPFGEIFDMEMDIVETKCHVTNPTAIEHCEVRSLADHAVDGDCDVKILKLDGAFSVQDMKCKSKTDSAEDVKDVCVGCALLASFNNTQVIQAVDASLLELNSPDNQTYYQLFEIGRAKIQVVRGIAVHIEYVSTATNCTTQEARLDVESCVPLTGDDAKFAFCVGTVVTDAVDQQVHVSVNCTFYDAQPGSNFAPVVYKDPSGAVIPNSLLDHAHHNLRHSNLGTGLLSSESFSAEVLAGGQAAPAPAPAAPLVKRSLTAVHLPASAPNLCPGKKYHY